MPKYLVKASYSPEGWQGVIKGGGGAARVDAVHDLVAGVGGSVESFYFGFGHTHAYITLDVPDNVSVAAITMAAAASGALAEVETVVLMTPEELDDAAKRTVQYRAPGSAAQAQ